MLDRLCEQAGVPRIRFHDLRHSCATLLYDQGVPIENIQDVLGHSSPTVTKTIYVEATRKVQRDAVDRLGLPLRRVRSVGVAGHGGQEDQKPVSREWGNRL